MINSNYINENIIFWQDVFDCKKLKNKEYEECRRIVKNVGYKFMAYKGYVYDVDDRFMKKNICTTKNIK